MSDSFNPVTYMPKTVLVADDEKVIRDALRRLLEYEKYRVIEA
jgi:CheY-like chemotaxis protein